MDDEDSLPQCYVLECDRRTKYKCVSCLKPICNVCSTEASGNPGYDEESKMIGICGACDNNESDSLELTSVISTQSEPKAKKQRTIDFFTERGNKKVSRKLDSSLKSEAPPRPSTKKNPKQYRIGTDDKKLKVSASTVEKWKSEMTKYNVAEWLTYETDSNGKARNLKCKVCIMYEKRICNLPNFSDMFIKGSQNYKKSAVEDHAKNRSGNPKHPHSVAYKLYLEGCSVGLDERSETLSLGVPNIVSCFKKLPPEEFERIRKKFETVYFSVKNEFSISAIKNILKLETKHGVDIGTKYLNDTSLANFLSYISDDLENKLVAKLNTAKFLSVLCDGSMDVAVRENEIICCAHFDPRPEGSDSVKVNISFVSVKHVKGGDHLSITDAINESFRELDLNQPFEEKLVGFCSDGASVNRGCKESIKTALQGKSPWLLFLWCIAHRLELSLEDALKSTSFAIVDEMLRQLFYLYRKAPKKYRQLKELHDEYEKIYEFETQSVKPKKSNGSRWVCHKLDALKMCKDKWSLYIAHLEKILIDCSYTTAEKAKMRGYLHKWKTSKMIIQVCFFIDLLTIPSILSLSFQKEDVNPVDSIRAFEKTLDRLELFMKKDFEKLPNVREFLSKVNEIDGEYYYQGVKLNSYENDKAIVSKEKNQFAALVRDCLSERLSREQESENSVKSIVTFLDCERWEGKEQDFADDIIYEMYDRFEVPLKKAGVNCSAADLLYQWHELVEYTKNTVGITGISYMKTWRKIFSSPRCADWSGILTLVELLFTLPISNAKIERIFSKLKRVLTEKRASLKEARLDDLIRIMEEGPSWELYHPYDAIKLWWDDADRRVSDEIGPRSYKKRKNKKRLLSLSDDDE